MNDRTEVTVFQEPRQLTAVDIRAQVNLVQEVMQAVMQKDVHYGKIPGTPKPTLYKAGGEKLAQTFRLAPSYITEDLSDSDCVRLRITCRLTHQTSGIVIGDGVGSCSSAEEKYRWRKPVCNEEFTETAEDRKREKWKRGQNGAYQEKQIRTEKADLENTIFKMAAKRAFLAAILNATAASDIFTQDIEDLPEELRPNEEPPKPTGPQPYTADQFAKNLPAWKSLIASGKKTADQIIATISSKAILSEEQKAAIRAAEGVQQ